MKKHCYLNCWFCEHYYLQEIQKNGINRHGHYEYVCMNPNIRQFGSIRRKPTKHAGTARNLPVCKHFMSSNKALKRFHKNLKKNIINQE